MAYPWVVTPQPELGRPLLDERTASGWQLNELLYVVARNRSANSQFAWIAKEPPGQRSSITWFWATV